MKTHLLLPFVLCLFLFFSSFQCYSQSQVNEDSTKLYKTITKLDSSLDRKSTRLNSSHGYTSYAVFCSKKKISMQDVFRPADSSKKFNIAEVQGYRYAPSYSSPAYHLLDFLPLPQEPASRHLRDLFLIP